MFVTMWICLFLCSGFPFVALVKFIALGIFMAFVLLSVTTTSQAVVALQMLRENKNKFDLVISDVHMPDMDGFKLLELVGLEMDLPVISKQWITPNA